MTGIPLEQKWTVHLQSWDIKELSPEISQFSLSLAGLWGAGGMVVGAGFCMTQITKGSAPMKRNRKGNRTGNVWMDSHKVTPSTPARFELMSFLNLRLQFVLWKGVPGKSRIICGKVFPMEQLIEVDSPTMDCPFFKLKRFCLYPVA